VAPYVEVRTATELPDGKRLLPPTFASSITGNKSYAGRTLNACARVAYGSPGTLNVAAITISDCEWNAMTANGANLPPPPAVVTPQADAEGVIYLHDPHGENPSNCSNPSIPGGFGWLEDTTGTCGTTATVGTSSPGNNTSSECTTELSAAWTSHGTELLPVFDLIRADNTYHIVGFSAFVLTGYNLSGKSKSSWLTHRDLCTGSSRCLYGYFTSAVLNVGDGLGTPSYGTSAVTLVG
jgi:hypothetical protein